MSAGAKSVMSDDMKELNMSKEDVSHKIQGHKANISNPNTSQQSKDNSQQVIDGLGGDDNLYGKQDDPRSKSAAQNLEGTRAG